MITNLTYAWLTMTAQRGYTGAAYLQALPDLDALVQTHEITGSPRAEYAVYFTTPGTYTVWVRRLASNAAGDSLYLGLGEQVTGVTGFAPGAWDWVSVTPSGGRASLTVETAGTYTISLRMREDGLRVDRLLLVTDTAYTPAGFGPAESGRQAQGGPGVPASVDRVIDYGYDDLYRLTSADYSSGEAYVYGYDPAGNRLQQMVNGAATSYQYDAANRLTSVNGQPYTWDANGNLLSTGAMTNTWDAANRLVAATRGAYALEPIYNGAGDRVAQTAGLTTTYFALDVQGLPEVIYTSGGEAYLHLPGVIAAVSAAGERRYLLSDGLGSIRQATDESGNVVAYHEFDPYGVPVQGGGEPYGYTAEWWEDEVDLLHLRARHYDPETGRFLSKDPWTGNVHIPQTKNGYVYVLNNPVTGQDPSGMICIFGYGNCDEEEDIGAAIATLPYRVFPQDFCLGELGCWGGQAYADFLQNEYYPYIPDYIDNDIEAIRDYWTSHVLSEAIDGYVIGWLETVATIPARSQPVSDPWDPNQCPGFGTTGYGREIVYDFVHQERGAFKYSAVGETFGIVGSGSFGGYRGFTDGFRNGVEDYAGQFASVGLSVDTPLQVPILRLSGTWTWANPYERGSYNPAGVHAVYFGGSLNAGLGLPISGNVLYSFYELDKSVPTPIKDYNGDDNDDKENSLVNRTLAAVHMQTDMTRDSGYDTDSHSGVLTDLALSFMWMWVGYSGD